jgi:capsular polysaccharide biosynthesis protein
VSRQSLDLRRSGKILWRHKILFAACAVIGLAGNVAHTILQPQTFSSNTLVVVSPQVNLDTQAVVVDSIPVLTDAMSKADFGMSLQDLQGHIQASTAGTQTLSIQAQGTTGAWAAMAANAVSNAYVAYVTSVSNPGGSEPAYVFLPATTPTVKPLTTRVYEAGLLGLIAGLGTGLIGALAIGRKDRRLRTRDAIADSIGVPVAASLSIRCPSDAAGWAKLLGEQPADAADSWRLRKVLRDLSLDGAALAGPPGSRDRSLAGGQSTTAGGSVTVLSVASDKTALALGPRLAAFAAAEGIPTTLVIGAQQAAPGGPGPGGAASPGGAGAGGAKKAPALTEAIVISATAAAISKATKEIAVLRAGAESAAVRNLRVSVRDSTALPGHPFAVAVGVVDGQAPRVAETTRADVTLLAVTAGAVTAEQLVRVSASAAADGREIAGVLVANPDPADETTGRVPELARPEEYRMPTRFSGVVTTESR